MQWLFGLFFFAVLVVARATATEDAIIPLQNSESQNGSYRILTMSERFALTTIPAGTFATLSETSGKVMINQAETHILAYDGADLMPGYRVMTMSDGFTRIEFSTGCTVTLRPREVFLVRELVACPDNGFGSSELAGLSRRLRSIPPQPDGQNSSL